MESWKEKQIIHRDDDSYVIEKNGYPYHVPNNDEFGVEYAEIKAYALEHQDQVTEEETYKGPTEKEILEQQRYYKLRDFEVVINNQKTAVSEYCMEKMIQQIASNTVQTLALDVEENSEANAQAEQKILELYFAMRQNETLRKDVETMQTVEEIKNTNPIVVS